MTPRIALILMMPLVGTVCLSAVFAAEAIDEDKAAKVKAAYVLNFARFTRWPDGAFEEKAAPLVIAVVGEEVLRPVLERTVAGTRHGKREIVVRRFSLPRRDRFDSAEAHRRAVTLLRERLAASHAVYFPANRFKQSEAYLNALRSEPILLIGDGRRFAERGTMLALGIDRDRIVFYANAEAIEGSALAVSSKLLRLARVIDPDG